MTDLAKIKAELVEALGQVNETRIRLQDVMNATESVANWIIAIDRQLTTALALVDDTAQDKLPVVSIGDASDALPGEDMEFALDLDAPSVALVKVTLSTEFIPSDDQPTLTTISIEPGRTRVMHRVAIPVDAADRTAVHVYITKAEGATVGDGVAAGIVEAPTPLGGEE